MLRQILHDWDDSQSLLILRNVREAIGGAKAHLVIVEVICILSLSSANLPVHH